MTNLFKKAILWTDLHFGLKSNSDSHNIDCINYINWMTDIAKKENCETCFFLGDYHNNRASMNIRTMNYAVKGLEIVSKQFDQTFFILGNHDLYFRDRRDIQSVEWAKHIPNIRVIDKFFKEGNVSIVPWLIEDEHKKIEKLDTRYMFGHFELPGYYMNASILMPDNGEIKREHFKNIGEVFSGHFHKRQTGKGNISYIGNCFPHNYADAGDDARGCVVLEWDKPPRYIDWPEQPKYRVYNLSDVLNNPDDLLKENMHVRVNLDIDISYEEATFIKENFAESYKLREISLLPIKSTNSLGQEMQTDIKFESVAQIVSDGIMTLDSEVYNKNLLLEIYNTL